MKVTLDELKSEISKFVSNGGKLGRVSLYDSVKNECCALGACYVNSPSNLDITDYEATSAIYSYMYNKYEISIYFCYGFDKSTSKNPKSGILDESELKEITNYELGFSLGLWCKEKGYI